MHMQRPPVGRIVLAPGEPVLLQGVDEAGHRRAGDARLLRQARRCLRLPGPMEEHEHGESPIARIVSGQKPGLGRENFISGPEQLQKRGASGDIELRKLLGSRQKALVAGEVLEH